jgi:hypothetical protein
MVRLLVHVLKSWNFLGCALEDGSNSPRFAGGHNRAKNPALAQALVNVRGGPEILLACSAADSAAFGASGGDFRVKASWVQEPSRCATY